jgi:hypothetical protein
MEKMEKMEKMEIDEYGVVMIITLIIFGFFLGVVVTELTIIKDFKTKCFFGETFMIDKNIYLCKEEKK